MAKKNTKKSYRRGDAAHYARLARRSVESRIQRHIVVPVLRDPGRVTTIPRRKRETDAGYDVTTPVPIVLAPGTSCDVPLGLRVNCPAGYFFEIRGRSKNNQVDVVATDNVIDATYTGELVVRLNNHGTAPFKAEVGDRIAQLVFLPQIYVQFVPVVKFVSGPQDRGDAGWGSSGNKAFSSE